MSDDHSSPHPIEALLDEAEKRLIARSRSQPAIPLDANQGMVLAGAWQESYPAWMGMEPILDCTERGVYSFLWIFAKRGGQSGVSFPSYEDIQRGTHIGARETVARALKVLRLTRWVTLCRRVRDDLGRNQGNIYALNDEPAPLPTACELDPGYMTFLESCLKHADVRTRAVALLVHQSIRHSLDGDGAILDSSLTAQIARRAEAQRTIDGAHGNYFEVQVSLLPDMVAAARGGQADLFEPERVNNPDNVGTYFQMQPEASSQVRLPNSVDGDRVRLPNSVPDDQKHRVRLPNSVSFPGDLQSSPTELINNNSSCSSSFNKTTTTTPEVNEGTARADARASGRGSTMAFPEGIDDSDQRIIEIDLQKVPENLHQIMLDELAGVIRMRKNTHDPIRSPSRYFHALVKLAKEGQWKPSALAKEEFQRRKQAEWLAQQRALSEAKARPDRKPED